MSNVVLITLSTASLVLPFIGAVRAYRSGRSALRKARVDSSRVSELRDAWEAEARSESARLGSDYNGQVVGEKYARLFGAAGLPVPSRGYADRNASGDLTVVRVLELLVESNLVNLGLILVGSLAGYVGTVIPLIIN